MTTVSHRTKALAASLAVAGLLLPLSTTPTALAVESTPYSADAAVSLTLHKYAVATDFTPGSNPSGKALDSNPSGATPVSGVEFTVTRLKDSTTKVASTQGMKELVAIAEAVKADPSAAASVETEGTPEVVTTGADGSVTVPNVVHGAYLVQETSVAGADYDGTLVPGAPFVAFLPTTSDEGNSFNYEVHAYPKNTTLPVEKKFSPGPEVSTDVQSGHDLNYAFSLGIPKVVSPDRPLTKYVISDALTPQVEYQDIVLRLATEADYSDLSADNVDSKGTELVRDTDYTVDSTSPLTVTFTSEGLTKLSAAQAADDRVVGIIKTKVTAAVEGTTLQNTIGVTFNNGYGGPDVPVDGSTPEGPSYGKLRVHKHQDGDTSVNLAGAKFDLHWCLKDSGQIDPANSDAIKSKVEGQTDITAEIVTNTDGVGIYEGLQKLADDSAKTYCLVETQAPDGYSLVKEPILVQNFTKTSDSFASDNTFVLDVPNIKRPNFLPGTGGEGLPSWPLLALLFGGGVAAAAFWGTRKKTFKTQSDVASA